MTQRVVVTGGAGFLGSHLCERLLAEQCDVLCVDNFYTGTEHATGLLRPAQPWQPVEFTIRELAEKVLSLTASKSRQPKVALDDGLKQTVRYFREPLAQ